MTLQLSYRIHEMASLQIAPKWSGRVLAARQQYFDVRCTSATEIVLQRKQNEEEEEEEEEETKRNQRGTNSKKNKKEVNNNNNNMICVCYAIPIVEYTKEVDGGGGHGDY